MQSVLPDYAQLVVRRGGETPVRRCQNAQQLGWGTWPSHRYVTVVKLSDCHCWLCLLLSLGLTWTVKNLPRRPSVQKEQLFLSINTQDGSVLGGEIKSNWERCVAGLIDIKLIRTAPAASSALTPNKELRAAVRLPRHQEHSQAEERSNQILKLYRTPATNTQVWLTHPSSSWTTMVNIATFFDHLLVCRTLEPRAKDKLCVPVSQ